MKLAPIITKRINRTTISAKFILDPPPYPPWFDIMYHHLLIEYILWKDSNSEMDKHGFLNIFVQLLFSYDFEEACQPVEDG